MTCTDVRQVLSAALDGEDAGPSLAGAPVSAAREHVAGCAECAEWEDAARRLGPLVLAGAGEAPDLTYRVLTAIEAEERAADRPRRRRRELLRVGVAVAAVAQLALGLPELLACLLGTGDSHASHEMAAFDLALSVGFLLAAWRPERARALVPVAVVLSGALLLVAGVDVAHSTIALAHELGHLVAVGQALLLWALCRADDEAPVGGAARMARGSAQ